MTPYNTGKVSIGLRVQSAAPYMDADAINCQRWLLGDGGAWTMPAWVRRVWGWL